MCCVFWGEQYISSGLTAVLSATFPFFVLIFAPVLIRTESITRRKIIGIFGAFVGVAMIFWHSLIPGQGSLAQLSLPGSLAIVGSAASSGLGTVIAKKYSSRIAPATNVMVQSIVGSVTLSFVGVVTEGGAAFEFSPTAIAAVLYLGVIASALAFVGWYWLFTKATATNSSLILLVTPVIALLLGWLILQEELEPVVALGTVLILSGVYVTVERDNETRRYKTLFRRSLLEERISIISARWLQIISMLATYLGRVKCQLPDSRTLSLTRPKSGSSQQVASASWLFQIAVWRGSLLRTCRL